MHRRSVIFITFGFNTIHSQEEVQKSRDRFHRYPQPLKPHVAIVTLW